MGHYDFFISYSHADVARIRRLDHALRELLRRPLRRAGFRVFRDERQLVAGPDLPEKLQAHLRASRTLVVALSAESSTSTWVDREIAFWCEDLGRARQMILVRLDSSVNWDDATGRLRHHDALLPALVRATTSEPLFIEMGESEASVQDAAVRIASVLLGRPPDEIAGEDFLRSRRRRRLTLGAVGGLAILAAVAAVAGTLAVGSSNEAQNREREAVAGLLAARGSAEANRRPDKALALALAAWRLDRNGNGQKVLTGLLRGYDVRDQFLRLPPRQTAVAIAPGGGMLAAGDSTGGVWLLHLADAVVPDRPSIDLGSGIVGLAFGDPERLIVGLADGRLLDLSITTGGVAVRSELGMPPLDGFTFNRATGRVAVSGRASPNTIWLLSWTGGGLQRLAEKSMGVGTAVTALAFDMAGTRLAIASSSGVTLLAVPSLAAARDRRSVDVAADTDARQIVFTRGGAIVLGGDPRPTADREGEIAVVSAISRRLVGKATFEQTVSALTSCRGGVFFGTEAGEYGVLSDPLQELYPVARTRPFARSASAIRGIACESTGPVAMVAEDGLIHLRGYAGEEGLALSYEKSALNLYARDGEYVNGAPPVDVKDLAIADDGRSLVTPAGLRFPVEARDAQRIGTLLVGEPEKTSNCLSLDEKDLQQDSLDPSPRMRGRCGDLEVWTQGKLAATTELRVAGLAVATFPAGRRLGTYAIAISSDRSLLFLGGFIEGVLYDISRPAEPEVVSTVPVQDVIQGASFAASANVLLTEESSPQGSYSEVRVHPIGGPPLERYACILGAGTLDNTVATELLGPSRRATLSCGRNTNADTR